MIEPSCRPSSQAKPANPSLHCLVLLSSCRCQSTSPLSPVRFRPLPTTMCNNTVAHTRETQDYGRPRQTSQPPIKQHRAGVRGREGGLPDDLSHELPHGHVALGRRRLELLVVVHVRLKPPPELLRKKFTATTSNRQSRRTCTSAQHHRTPATNPRSLVARHPRVAACSCCWLRLQ